MPTLTRRSALAGGAAIAALGMFNVTNQYTFGSIFQREMGAKGDVGRRRAMVADLILSYLTRGGSS